MQKSGDENLKKVYNDCVESLIQFRSFHIQIVTRLVQLTAILHKVQLIKTESNKDEIWQSRDLG